MKLHSPNKFFLSHIISFFRTNMCSYKRIKEQNLSERERTSRQSADDASIVLMTGGKEIFTLHKKWSFPLRISSVKLNKFAGNYESGHICWRNSNGKFRFLSSAACARWWLRAPYRLHIIKPRPEQLLLQILLFSS